jgi:hypothetical protein
MENSTGKAEYYIAFATQEVDISQLMDQNTHRTS